MRLFFFLILSVPTLAWGQRYQLTTPRILADSVFFRQKATVQLDFDLDGAMIYYTADGNFPSDSSPVYKKPFSVDKSTAIRAKAVHPDFITSPIVEQQLLQVSILPDSALLRVMPDSMYRGQLAATLFDLRKGGHDLHDGRWIGFKGDTAIIEVKFKQPVTNRSVQVSTLFDPEAWIYPPAGIEVLGKNGDKDWMPIGKWTAHADAALSGRPARYDLFQKVLLRRATTDRLQIRIIPFGTIPPGQKGEGNPAWLFLDEVVFQ